MEDIKITIDGNSSTIQGTEAIEKFHDGIRKFAESLPKGSELIVTDFEFKYNEKNTNKE